MAKNKPAGQDTGVVEVPFDVAGKTVNATMAVASVELLASARAELDRFIAMRESGVWADPGHALGLALLLGLDPGQTVSAVVGDAAPGHVLNGLESQKGDAVWSGYWSLRAGLIRARDLRKSMDTRVRAYEAKMSSVWNTLSRAVSSRN